MEQTTRSSTGVDFAAMKQKSDGGPATGWFRTPAVATLLLTVLGSGCAYPSLAEIAPEINATLAASALFLAADDQIDLKFPKRPEWNHTVIVRGDGRASFLFLDELVVAGKTMTQLDAIIRAAYKAKDVLRDEDIEFSLNLTAVQPRRVVVMGEVGSPGPIEIQNGHLTLIEALGKAGGPDKSTALLEETLLVRWLPQEQRLRTWRFDASVDNWQSGVPVLLQSHDVIFVPNTAIDRVNIWINQYIRQTLPVQFAIPIPY
jgi:polysaccharide export outer membrane protein